MQRNAFFILKQMKLYFPSIRRRRQLLAERVGAKPLNTHSLLQLIDIEKHRLKLCRKVFQRKTLPALLYTTS